MVYLIVLTQLGIPLEKMEVWLLNLTIYINHN